MSFLVLGGLVLALLFHWFRNYARTYRHAEFHTRVANISISFGNVLLFCGEVFQKRQNKTRLGYPKRTTLAFLMRVVNRTLSISVKFLQIDLVWVGTQREMLGIVHFLNWKKLAGRRFFIQDVKGFMMLFWIRRNTTSSRWPRSLDLRLSALRR